MRDFLEEIVVPFVVMILIIIVVASVGVGINYHFFAKPQSKLFNENHDTTYTAWEWLTSRDMIRDYINKEGRKSTVNLNVSD